MNDWNIQGRAHQCQACGRPFADKQPYHTLLLDEKQAYCRLDVCEACWKSQYRHGAQERKGFVSCWQGVYEVPPAPAEPIRRETAESLLRKIIERNDSCHAAAAYILAVMLERKRLLKVKEQLQSEGRRVFVYEQPKSGDLFTIPDPQLQLNQLDDVQRAVAALLEHGLPEAPASPEAGPLPHAPLAEAGGTPDVAAVSAPASDGQTPPPTAPSAPLAAPPP